MTAVNPVILLNPLLDDELNSPARYLEVAMPYVEPELVNLREPLKQMLETRRWRCRELIAEIQKFDGEPAVYRFRKEEQYLAFLSLKYLLPKLIEWKNCAILLHERALMQTDEGSDLHDLIARHLEQHRWELDELSER